jgi:hypothetical protein
MTEDDHVVSFSLFSAVSCVEEKKELDDEWKRKKGERDPRRRI